MVAPRLAPEAPDWLRHKTAAGEASPATEVQRGGEDSPHGQLHLAGRETSSVSCVVVAPLSGSNARVPQDQIQGKVGRVSNKDTPGGGFSPLKDDPTGPTGCYLLQGSGLVPLRGTEQVIPVVGDRHPQLKTHLRLQPADALNLASELGAHQPPDWRGSELRGRGVAPASLPGADSGPFSGRFHVDWWELPWGAQPTSDSAR